ncbi:unnamed protein product [Closterium sp. NIES-53]
MARAPPCHAAREPHCPALQPSALRPAALPSASRPTALRVVPYCISHVAPCCSPRVALYCSPRVALCCPTRRALLPCTARALLPCPPRALPCSPRRALPCPAAPPSPAEPRRPARAALPNPSCAALPQSPAPLSRPAATTATVATHATTADGGGAAKSAGSAAGAGGAGGATGSAGVAAARGGQRRSLPLPDDPTPQQLREWVLQRARPGGGGFGFLRTAQRRQQSQQETFSPQVLSELVPQQCVTGSVEAAALGASESAAALGANESTAALGASESAAALGASESTAAPDASESAAALGALASPATGPSSAEALHTFTLDSGASRCFFRDCTALTPLAAPIPISLADPTGDLVVARASTVLPCPAVPSGSLLGLHLPTFSTNLVSNASIQDVWVDTFILGGQRVAICTCSRTGRHLASFTRRPGSSLYTLTTASTQVAASSQVSASGQLAASRLCRVLYHQTLLWHHRLGHPSLPRLRSMHSRLLVSGLPRSLPSLPRSPALACCELLAETVVYALSRDAKFRRFLARMPQRYVVVLLTAACTTVCYIERVGFSVAYSLVANRNHVDQATKGWVLSAFYYGYALSQVGDLRVRPFPGISSGISSGVSSGIFHIKPQEALPQSALEVGRPSPSPSLPGGALWRKWIITMGFSRLDRPLPPLSHPSSSSSSSLTSPYLPLPPPMSLPPCQVPGSSAAQRYGGRRVITVAFLAWTALSLLTPSNPTSSSLTSPSLLALLLIRFLVGATQGFIFPSIHTVLALCIPPHEKSRAVSLTMSGMYLGAGAAMSLMPAVTAGEAPWGGPAAVFRWSAGLGLMWVVLWVRLFSKDPPGGGGMGRGSSGGGGGSSGCDGNPLSPRLPGSKHDLLQDDNVKDSAVVSGGSSSSCSSSKAIPWGAMMSSWAIWAIVINNYTFHYALYVLMNWLPSYFEQALHTSLQSIGIGKSLPYYIMMIFSNVGGVAADFLITSQYLSIAATRKVLNTVGFLIGAMALCLMPVLSSVTGAILCSTITLGACAFARAGFSVNHMDIAPRYAGPVMGISNTAGTLAGIVGVAATGLILQAWATDIEFGWWVAFVTPAGLCVLSAAIFCAFATGERLFD